MELLAKHNRMIAEFMGFKLQDNPNERWFGQFFTTPTKVWSGRIEILHFDTSWDWLMPVTAKCKSIMLQAQNMKFAGGNPVVSLKIQSLYEDLETALLSFNIEATHMVAVQFIKLYNEIK